MSINGVLEDLPLADVLQFIHLGRRTGTLYMWRGEDRRAEIGFHDGRIITAWTPNQDRLGDLLVGGGYLHPDALEEALQQQRGSGKGQSIGHLLLDQKAVTREEIYAIIREQIQKTVFDLVTWRKGHFQFEVGELHPMDDFAISPAELLDNLDINTQMLVLEATRLQDERAGLVQDGEDLDATILDRRLRRAGLGRTGGPVDDLDDTSAGLPSLSPIPEPMRCQVVTADRSLGKALSEALVDEQARVVVVPLREAGTRLPGEILPPIVLLDLRAQSLSDIATLSRTRPSAPLVALVAAPEQESAAYEAGAAAVVVPQVDRVADCCRNLIRVLSYPVAHGSSFAPSVRGGFSRFRRMVYDAQSGLLSASMALNLLHVISESVERAVLFLVESKDEGEQLQAFGAFGFSHLGRSLAEETRGLHLDLPGDSALRRAVEQGKPQAVDFNEAQIPQRLAELVGRPASGQVVIFPVLGAERPIAVLYTDNGASSEEIRDIKILELATSQVGVAFENELLRYRLGGDRLVERLPDA